MMQTQRPSHKPKPPTLLKGQKAIPGQGEVQKIKRMHVLALILGVVIIGWITSGTYGDYVIKSRVSNLLLTAHDAQIAVEWYMTHVGNLPTCNTDPKVDSNTVGFTEVLPGSMKYVDKMHLAYNCVIEIKGATWDIAPNLPGSLSLILCPTKTPGVEVKWSCMYYDSNAETGPWTPFVPPHCKTPFYWNGDGMDTCGH